MFAGMAWEEGWALTSRLIIWFSSDALCDIVHEWSATCLLISRYF